jgi:hypothetical protein
MNFRRLIETLSRRIGHHQLPVNPSASELRGFIDSGAIHYELVTQIVTAIYTGNRCRRLADPVTRDATFEALEPIRLAVLRSHKTDVDVYQLMDAVCAEVAHVFEKIQRRSVHDASPGPAAARLLAFRPRLKTLP